MERIKDVYVRPNTQSITHTGGALNLDLGRYDCFDITLNGDLDTLTISNPAIGEDYKIIFRQDTVVRTVTLPVTILVKGETVAEINQANVDTCIVFVGFSSTEILETGKVDPEVSLTKASQAEAEAGTEDTKYLTSNKGYLGWLSWVANKIVAGLNTTATTIVGAINELYANASKPTTDDQGITCLVTVSDGNPVASTGITGIPLGRVDLVINNSIRRCGDGVKTEEYYWSTDSGATALALDAVVQGAIPYWNGSETGFQLDTNDTASYKYNVR